MKKPGVSKNWGGKRAGSGEKKQVKIYSERVKNNYLAAAKIIQEETGKSIEEHYLRMSIDPKVQPAARAAFAKLYNEALLVKQSEQTINDLRQGPRIGLPPEMPRPKEEEKEAEQAGAVH